MVPAIFFGHGNPMNALLSNRYTEAWRRIGLEMPRPKAILSISAHWFVSKPQSRSTLHRGQFTISATFRLSCMRFNTLPLGAPGLARRVQELLTPLDVNLDESWGLDHGTWSVLRHVYPDADVPVVQLSLDDRMPASVHFEIGKKLAPLRSEGVLIIGSGNLVHNLRTYAWGRHMPDPYDWADRFERAAKELMIAEDYKPLIDYGSLGPDAALAIPTPEHYLPLLYVLGARQRGETVHFPVEGVDGGSMLTVQIA